jgi:sugar/nucleoside kinase (ribokinase family)
MKKFDVALFGSVFVDHVLTGFARWPAPGEEVFAQGYKRDVGGGCFTTACGLATLGVSTTCFARLGRQDSLWILERVRSFGTSTDSIVFSDLPTAMTVAVSLEGDRSFFTFDGANGDLPGWLQSPELPGLLAAAQHVHFAYPLPPEPGLRIVRALHAQGSTVSLDVGWQESWLCGAQSWSLLAELDLFLPNEREAALMTGTSETREMLRIFSARGARGVVVKLGARGAALWSESRVIHKAAVPLAVLDTTGAGDAFDAGFLHAYLAGMPPEMCLERGTICGSLSARKAGSLDAFPDLKEVLQHHEHYAKR